MSGYIKKFLESALDVIKLRGKFMQDFRKTPMPSTRTDNKKPESEYFGPPIRLLQRIDAVKMAHTIYSSDPKIIISEQRPIIILHDMLGSKENWVSMAKALAMRTNNVVIPADLRNHGNSPHRENCTYDYMADDLKLLLEDLSVEKATFLGHGMGGRAAMYFAHTYPERVDKLLIVDIAPMGFPPCYEGTRYVIEIMRNIINHGRLSVTEARRLATADMIKFVPNCDIKNFITTSVIKDDNNRYCWKQNLDAISRDFLSMAVFPMLLSPCTKPTYFIAGKYSGCVRQSDVPEIRRYFPNSRFHYVESGHWVHLHTRSQLINWAGEILRPTVSFQLY